MAGICQEVPISDEVGDVETIEALLLHRELVKAIERKASHAFGEDLRLDSAPTVGTPFSEINPAVRAVLVGKKQNAEGAVWILNTGGKPITIQTGLHEKGWSLVPVRAEHGEKGRILQTPKLIYLRGNHPSSERG